MITELRRFNERGIEQFRIALHQIKDGEIDDVPTSLLTDHYASDIVDRKVMLERQTFISKELLINFINNEINQIYSPSLLYDAGLWTWLSAYFFDSICPKNGHGKRTIREDSKYVLNNEEWNKYYRHLLASPTRLLRDLSELATIYLAGKPDVPGDLFEQLASRQEVATCKGIIEAATILYWDKENERIKKGVRSKEGAGILRRFVQATIPQFQMTYDLNSMTGSDVIQLLPNEYNRWMPINN